MSRLKIYWSVLFFLVSAIFMESTLSAQEGKSFQINYDLGNYSFYRSEYNYSPAFIGKAERFQLNSSLNKWTDGGNDGVDYNSFNFQARFLKDIGVYVAYSYEGEDVFHVDRYTLGLAAPVLSWNQLELRAGIKVNSLHWSFNNNLSGPFGMEGSSYSESGNEWNTELGFSVEYKKFVASYVGNYLFHHENRRETMYGLSYRGLTVLDKVKLVPSFVHIRRSEFNNLNNYLLSIEYKNSMRLSLSSDFDSYRSFLFFYRFKRYVELGLGMRSPTKEFDVGYYERMVSLRLFLN